MVAEIFLKFNQDLTVPVGADQINTQLGLQGGTGTNYDEHCSAQFVANT